MIIPADINQMLRATTASGGAPIGSSIAASLGGGPQAAGSTGASAPAPVVNVNFAVSAIDQAGVQNFFKRNQMTIANVVGQAVRNAPQQMTTTVKSIAGPAY
jgi:hypothetical protein